MVLCLSIPLQKFFLFPAVQIILKCRLNNFFWMTPYLFLTFTQQFLDAIQHFSVRHRISMRRSVCWFVRNLFFFFQMLENAVCRSRFRSDVIMYFLRFLRLMRRYTLFFKSTPFFRPAWMFLYVGLFQPRMFLVVFLSIFSTISLNLVVNVVKNKFMITAK